MISDEEAKEKCAKDFYGVMKRWMEESDLAEEEILEALDKALDKWSSEEIVDFEADPNLLDE